LISHPFSAFLVSIPLTTVARELSLELLQRGYTPQQLRPSCSNPEELDQRFLDEAIGLREQGKSAESLWLLERGLAMGLTNPWIHDNRARALVAIGERQRARAIWLQLAQQGSGMLASTAAEMAALQERTLIEALRAVAQRHGYGPDQLEQGNEDLLTLVLQELIRSREGNWSQVSLEMAETTLALGWRSPWLLDNQARALVALGRHPEALELWKTVAAGDDAVAAAAADEMLELYGARERGYPPAGYEGWRADREWAERAEKLRAENPADAETVLLEALADLPDPRRCRQLLEQWLGEGIGNDATFPELRQEEVALTLQEKLFDLLASRLKPAGDGG
jgi:hypothetical protein